MPIKILCLYVYWCGLSQWLRGNAGDLGLIPGLGRHLRGGNGNPLQYSRLKNPMDRGAWWATVQRVAQSHTDIWPGFPGGASGKEPAGQCRRCKRHGFDSWVGNIPWSRAWQPIPVFLPWESHGQRSLAGYTVPSVARRQTWLKWLSTHHKY